MPVSVLFLFMVMSNQGIQVYKRYQCSKCLVCVPFTLKILEKAWTYLSLQHLLLGFNYESLEGPWFITRAVLLDSGEINIAGFYQQKLVWNETMSSSSITMLKALPNKLKRSWSREIWLLWWNSPFN